MPSPSETNRVNNRRIAVCSLWLGGCVQLLAASCDDPRQPAQRLISTGREHAGLVSLEQFGQRVLQQGERARLVDDIGDDPGGQGHVRNRARAPGRFDDCGFEFVGGERKDSNRAALHERCELAESQWPIEEVGTQREYEPQPGARLGDCFDEAGDEAVAFGVNRSTT